MGYDINIIARHRLNTERLIACVMENMADEAIRILRSGIFDKKVLEDVGGCEVSMPLSMITRCYYILLDDISSWNESFQHVVIQQKSGCKKLMDFWFTEYGCPVYEETRTTDFQRIRLTL